MPLRLLCIILFQFLTVPAFSGTWNKCIQTDGKVEYGDRECALGTATNPGLANGTAQNLLPSENGVDSISTITILAGSKGLEGVNDGTGTSARFRYPVGVTSDGNNLYLTEAGNQTIRKLELTTGRVTTLAGTAGARGYKDGIGSNARFNIPTGITNDGKYLYVVDSMNNCIRKIDINNGAVTTLVGNPRLPGRADGIGIEATFSSPQDITEVDGNLYVTEQTNNTVRKINIATGAVTTFAGKTVTVQLEDGVTSFLPGYIDGVGQDARFALPSGITNDGKNLYVSDKFNNKVRKIEIASGNVTTLAGPNEAVCATGWHGKCPGGYVDGSASTARFSYPMSLATDGSFLYVVSSGNTIRKVALATGDVTTLISREAGFEKGAEVARQAVGIWGILVAKDQSLIVTDRSGHAIYKIQ